MFVWDMYEIRSTTTSIYGVKLRGTMRKWANDNQLNLLIENASDTQEQCVRFCVLENSNIGPIKEYIETLVTDVTITPILMKINNPIPSSLKHNDDSRYDGVLKNI